MPPRRRIRRTDANSRNQKMWAASRKPGMGGVMPFGPSSRGGGTTIVGRPGGGSGGEVRIDHVTLYAVEGQTIADGGGTVQWFRRGAPPTEQVGFDTLADALDGGAVGDIPIDVTGELEIVLDGVWTSYRSKGDITITRTRSGSTAVATFDLGPIRSRAFDGVTLGWGVQAGDTITVDLPNDSGSGQTLQEATVGLRVIAPSFPTSAVPQPTVPEMLGISEGATGNGPTEPSVPAGVEAGHLLLALVYGSGGGSAPAFTEPDGWTLEHGTNEALSSLLLVYSRVADGTEAASYNWDRISSANAAFIVNVGDGTDLTFVTAETSDLDAADLPVPAIDPGTLFIYAAAKPSLSGGFMLSSASQIGTVSSSSSGHREMTVWEDSDGDGKALSGESVSQAMLVGVGIT